MTELLKRAEAEIERAETESADPILMMIQSAARDPETDVAKMERMFYLYERQQAREAEKAFNRDFIALQDELPEIDEGGKIVHNGKVISKYARWDEDINPAIRPILARHNFTLSFEVETSDRIKVVAHLIHADGHSRSSSFTSPPDKSGAKNEVQAMGSAVSYAKRYAAAPLLNLTMRGQDDDGRAACEDELIDASTQADIEALADEVLTDPKSRVAFSDWLKRSMKVPNGFIRNIPKNKVSDVVAALERKRGQS